jgi:hypothetical protein
MLCLQQLFLLRLALLRLAMPNTLLRLRLASLCLDLSCSSAFLTEPDCSLRCAACSLLSLAASSCLDAASLSSRALASRRSRSSFARLFFATAGGSQPTGERLGEIGGNGVAIRCWFSSPDP